MRIKYFCPNICEWLYLIFTVSSIQWFLISNDEIIDAVHKAAIFYADYIIQSLSQKVFGYLFILITAFMDWISNSISSINWKFSVWPQIVCIRGCVGWNPGTHLFIYIPSSIILLSCFLFDGFCMSTNCPYFWYRLHLSYFLVVSILLTPVSNQDTFVSWWAC